MNFTVHHGREGDGTALDLYVTSSRGEAVSSVAIRLDGQVIAETELPPGTECYSRAFAAAGRSGRRYAHVLEVAATDQHGELHRSITSWTDGS